MVASGLERKKCFFSSDLVYTLIVHALTVEAFLLKKSEYVCVFSVFLVDLIPVELEIWELAFT